MKNKSLLTLIIILFISLLTLNWANSNRAEIAGMQADYYYKKNNLEKAQKYYEEAFSLGLNDTERRETYVNSLINTPLTTNTQEKLIRFIEYPINDSAKHKAEEFIYSLRREIHRQFPENFITQTVYNQKVVRWGNLPITYGFIGNEETEVPQYFIDEIENAFLEIEKELEHQIYFSKDDKNPNIVINFDPNNPVDETSMKYVVAYTIPVISTNHLENFIIKFYLKDPLGEYYSENQTYNTALHEIIHALGFMGHSNEKDHIMYISKDNASVQNDSRENLTQADINTVKLLYKLKPDISNIKNADGKYIPELVMGESEEISSAKLREAQLYVKRAPHLPAGYIDLAEAYITEHDYDNAIKSLKKAYRLADTEEVQGMVLYNLAVTTSLAGNNELAIDYLTKSMSIADTDEKHYLLAEIFAKDGKFKDAINEYQNLIYKNPQNIEYTIALTNLYVNNKEYLKAREVLKKYIKNNPQDKNNPRFQPYGILRLFL